MVCNHTCQLWWHMVGGCNSIIFELNGQALTRVRACLVCCSRVLFGVRFEHFFHFCGPTVARVCRCLMRQLPWLLEPIVGTLEGIA